MVKRHFTLYFLFFLISTSYRAGFSQPIDITASEPDFNYGSTHIHKIIGHDSDYFYVLKFHGNQYYIEKLDKGLNIIKENRIKLVDKLKTYDLETMVHFYGQLYVFASRRRFSDVVLYFQKIDKETLQPTTDLIEFTTIGFISGNWPAFHFVLSRHETKLLLACQIKLMWTKVQVNEYYVFGEDLRIILKRNDSFEFTGQGPRENSYVVDEMGNFSMLSLQKRESIFSLFSANKNTYTIYRYTNEGRDFREYPVSFPKRYIRGIKIIGGDNGELICAGLYSELYRAGMRGSFFFKINAANTEMYDNTMNPFTEDFISRLEDLDEPTIKSEELIDYIMTDLVLRDNGKIIFIAEQFFKQSYDTYNNLIILCYDIMGNVYWSQVIEKNQDFNVNSFRDPELEVSAYRDVVLETGILDQSIEDYCSYALMAPVDGSGIIIFYNDNIKNVDGNQSKNFNRPKKSYLAAVRIDEFGNMTRQPLLKWKRKALYPEPIRFYDTRYSTIIIPAFRGRKYNYYKITADF